MDEYFTHPGIAQWLIDRTVEIVPEAKRQMWLEPSAGKGAFSSLLTPFGSPIVAVDIKPQSHYIQKADFLKSDALSLGLGDPSQVCTIGNPPFGHRGSIARKFLTHAMSMSDVVCFILPRSFRKDSVLRGIDENFKLKMNEALGRFIFYKGLEPFHVNTCFQIWMRSKTRRIITPRVTTSKLFTFTKDKNNADLAIRRAGSKIGAVANPRTITADGWWFVKLKSISDAEVEKRLKRYFLHFEGAGDVAGQRSISKEDLIRAIEEG